MHASPVDCAHVSNHSTRHSGNHGDISMQANLTERVVTADVLDDSISGVSWPAILAGATGAAALSYVLVILGFGLGLSALSPWTNSGTSANAIGVATIVWLAFTQIAASGMGGYLAGRLRSKWAGVHDDEVYFRDTAHGFLSWAIASLVVVAFLASSVATIINGGASVAGAAIEAAGAGATAMAAKVSERSNEGSNYFVDTLFRGNPATSATTTTPGEVDTDNDVAMAAGLQHVTPAQRIEAARILTKSLASDALRQEDKTYLGQVIGTATGVDQQEAEQRVETAYNDMKQSIETTKTTARKAADEARKLSAHASLWLFVSLLMGAFCASVAAIFGGRSRDKLVWTSTRTYR